MNWFQIVFLREDSQGKNRAWFWWISCELISNCIFTWGLTSFLLCSWRRNKLWIDFKLYFYVRTHKWSVLLTFDAQVVNWFQIVFLREDSQVTVPHKQGHTCCELISNCIFTWGLTSRSFSTFFTILLCIDFKLYFYVRTHKLWTIKAPWTGVVNWFQIVFLREDSQVRCLWKARLKGCELISNCIFTWGLTRALLRRIAVAELWIDFKLYFYVRTHKHCFVFSNCVLVVNWFQIVFLREDSQEETETTRSLYCCELISNCIFTWGLTRWFFKIFRKKMLWIDFKLYFYVRTHKKEFYIYGVSFVVNWFQIVFLREDSQVPKNRHWKMSCCELISNCIFTWGLTRRWFLWIRRLLLWIDFKLYFYVRTHKFRFNTILLDVVVNWFQIVFLREDSQVIISDGDGVQRCELISNCIFTWGLTSFCVCRFFKMVLWIDFKLYFYVRTHKEG